MSENEETSPVMRIYWSRPKRQLTVNQAVIYLATGQIPFEVWKEGATEEQIRLYSTAGPEQRKLLLSSWDGLHVSMGRMVHHNGASAIGLAPWGTWQPIRGTEVEIFPRQDHFNGNRITIAIPTQRLVSTDEAIWILQTIGAANQIALSAEGMIPVIEQMKEREGKQ